MTHSIPDRSLAAYFCRIPILCGENEVSHIAKNGKSGASGWASALVFAMPNEQGNNAVGFMLQRPDPVNSSDSQLSAKTEVLPLKLAYSYIRMVFYHQWKKVRLNEDWLLLSSKSDFTVAQQVTLSVPVPFCEMDAVKYLGNGATVLWRFTFVVQSKNSRKRWARSAEALICYNASGWLLRDERPQIMKSSGRNCRFIKGMI